MREISALPALKVHIEELIKTGKSIGFVPTMGALHEGHFKLIRNCKEENDVTVVSIFVNPTQFNNSEDLANYPRNLEQDTGHLKRLGVDVVFIPVEQDLYPEQPTISINFGGMADTLEGSFRKGHFEGVGTIVTKLLHLVQPTNAYFGLKDLQQYVLIRLMCKQLNFPSKIIGVETERETSGLALSSRNQRLSATGLEVASSIYQGLKMIEHGLKQEKSLLILLKEADAYYNSVDGLEIEYLEAINPLNFQSVETTDKLNELAICIAGYVEGIRLIDNLYLRLK